MTTPTTHNGTYRLTYQIPPQGRWHTHTLNLELLLVAIDILHRLQRQFRVETPRGDVIRVGPGTGFAYLTCSI